MAKRLVLVWCALALALVAFAAQSVTMPGTVLACSCISPLPTLAESAANPRTTIVIATVGQSLADRTPLAVEGRFVGTVAEPIVWIGGGTNVMSSCDIGLGPGERWLLVLRGPENGLFGTGSCDPSGRIGTPAGDALVAEAVALFGPPDEPPAPVPDAPAPIDVSPWLGGIGWVVAVGALGAAVFVLVILVAKRRPSG